VARSNGKGGGTIVGPGATSEVRADMLLTEALGSGGPINVGRYRLAHEGYNNYVLRTEGGMTVIASKRSVVREYVVRALNNELVT
jgi:DNA-binding phage protein